MSLMAIGWAWQRDIEDPLAKLVLLYLADVAQENEDGEIVAFPSNSRICRFTAASESTVRRKIRALAKLGFISAPVRRTRKNGSDTSNAHLLLGCHTDGQPDTRGGVTGTPLASLERKTKEPLAASPQSGVSKQDRDLVWDSLVVVFGEPTTTQTKLRFGRTQRELLSDSTLTPAQVAVAIPIRAARYRQMWPGITLTLEALAKHWTTMAPAADAPAIPDGDVDALGRELEDDGSGTFTF